MRITSQDLNTGWYGVFVDMNDSDIDRLCELLLALKNGEIDHFHCFETEFDGAQNNIADIQFGKISEQDINTAGLGP